MPDPADNARERDYWNSPATRAWAREHDRIDSLFAEVLALVLDRAAPQPGERVLDIGCGSGTSVLALAEAVGPTGRVLGADIAAESVALAGARIAAAGLAQAQVVLADAAAHPFEPAGFDLLFSRFGVMFFANPVAAFAHLRRALAPEGRVAMAAFRPGAENPWATAPVAAVRPLLPPMPPPDPEAPGQFAFGDSARVRRILDGAGFGDIRLEPRDLGMRLGADPREAADFALTVGQTVRALVGAPDSLRAEVRAALEAWFCGHEGPEGVVLPGAIWLITARA